MCISLIPRPVQNIRQGCMCMGLSSPGKVKQQNYQFVEVTWMLKSWTPPYLPLRLEPCMHGTLVVSVPMGLDQKLAFSHQIRCQAATVSLGLDSSWNFLVLTIKPRALYLIFCFSYSSRERTGCPNLFLSHNQQQISVIAPTAGSSRYITAVAAGHNQIKRRTLLRVAIATYHFITYVVYIHSTSAQTKSFISQSLKPDYTGDRTHRSQNMCTEISLTG